MSPPRPPCPACGEKFPLTLGGGGNVCPGCRRPVLWTLDENGGPPSWTLDHEPPPLPRGWAWKTEAELHRPPAWARPLPTIVQVVAAVLIAATAYATGGNVALIFTGLGIAVGWGLRSTL